MYLAMYINEALETIKTKLVNRSPAYFVITNILDRAFKEEKIKFKYETYNEIDKNMYSVSGLYDMEKDKRYIIFNFSSKGCILEINERNWKDFKFEISQVIQHETIHRDQWSARDFEITEKFTIDFRSLMGQNESREEEMAYLADIDEIDAYAHDIAMEIKHYYPKNNPYNVLKTINSKRKLWSYKYYKNTFRGEEWYQIKKLLLKKTYLWLPYVTV